VPRYSKIEFEISAPTGYRDPFDPAVVDLSVEISGVDGNRVRVPAFICQEYERRGPTNGLQRDWCYPTGAMHWKARFAPPAIGSYRAVAILKDADGERRSAEAGFTAVNSDRKGFVRVSRKDTRFLEFDNGEAFFPVGQNLAFIGSQQYVTLTRAEEIFRRLSEQGANYLRIWTCADDWALAIEARKSAWGRSWSGKGKFQTMPSESNGKAIILDSAKLQEVNPSHPVALRPGTEYVLVVKGLASNATVRVEVHGASASTETSAGSPAFALRREFRTDEKEFWLGALRLLVEGKSPAWISEVSLTEKGGGPELLWEAEMNRPERGYYNSLDSFLLDQILPRASAMAFTFNSACSRVTCT
jgi:hypothetical protein